MKKVFTSLLMLILMVGLVTGCSCEKKANKENNNGNVLDENANVEIRDQKVNELDIVDFLVVYENDISDVYFTIENNTEEAVTYNEIECNIYDKNKGLIYSFKEDVGTLEALDEKEINHRVNIDLTKVAEVEYVFK